MLYLLKHLSGKQNNDFNNYFHKYLSLIKKIIITKNVIIKSHDFLGLKKFYQTKKKKVILDPFINSLK